jgi:hypothetical protein
MATRRVPFAVDRGSLDQPFVIIVRQVKADVKASSMAARV